MSPYARNCHSNGCWYKWPWLNTADFGGEVERERRFKSCSVPSPSPGCSRGGAPTAPQWRASSAPGSVLLAPVQIAHLQELLLAYIIHHVLHTHRKYFEKQCVCVPLVGTFHGWHHRPCMNVWMNAIGRIGIKSAIWIQSISTLDTLYTKRSTQDADRDLTNGFTARKGSEDSSIL